MDTVISEWFVGVLVGILLLFVGLPFLGRRKFVQDLRSLADDSASRTATLVSKTKRTTPSGHMGWMQKRMKKKQIPNRYSGFASFPLKENGTRYPAYDWHWLACGNGGSILSYCKWMQSWQFMGPMVL